MSAVDVQVANTVTAAAAAAAPQVSGPAVAKIAARVGANRITAHLESVAGLRHRAFMPHDFYLTAARSTTSSSDGSTATISITGPAGIRLRYFGSGGLPGGVVKASGRVSRATGRPITKLAIPDGRNQAAQARTPADFTDLRLVIFGRRPGAKAALVRGKGDAMRVYYWLRDATTHRADTSILPDLTQLGEDIRREALDRIRRAWERKQQATT